MSFEYMLPADLTLGQQQAGGVSAAEQTRQKREAEEILRRLKTQPGLILADEVGMGKTYVALAAAVAVGCEAKSGPVIVMVPGKLVDKWARDLKAFFEHYRSGAQAIEVGTGTPLTRTGTSDLRYGLARNALELFRLMDDPAPRRSQIIILAASAMQRRQTDPWVRLYLIAEALRRHGRRKSLAGVRKSIGRFLARILYVQSTLRSHSGGQGLLERMLRESPASWRERYNAGLKDCATPWHDDPVPKALIRAMDRIDLSPIAEALAHTPRRETARVEAHLKTVRDHISAAEHALWQDALAKMNWHSPLLVLDEAHHLKNPSTTLASAFQEFETGIGAGSASRGAFARRFDRMLFLTATPFQLGHAELAKVLDRFTDVRRTTGDPACEPATISTIKAVEEALNKAQRAGIAFHKAWNRLESDEVTQFSGQDLESVTAEQTDTGRLSRALRAFAVARDARKTAQEALRPWVIRHNKGEFWADTVLPRRDRVVGGRIRDPEASGGLPVAAEQTLPFFLATRSVAEASKDLLGEALSSSYAAFRDTRQNRRAAQDAEAENAGESLDEVSNWYLGHFDRALEGREGLAHPKVAATVKHAVDLWHRGEKVLVFAFYIETCRTLRKHISREIERRVYDGAREALSKAGGEVTNDGVDLVLERIRNRFFDAENVPGRRALDAVLNEIIAPYAPAIGDGNEALVGDLVAVMRRFLRVQTSLLRFFPIDQPDLAPDEAVRQMLDATDESALSWRAKLTEFCRFLAEDRSRSDREALIAALLKVQTRGIRGEIDPAELEDNSDDGEVFLPNVQMVIGKTKQVQRDRLMQCFNTPFFPEVLVCSEVMGEGVDLHRACRYVIHHDLAWNPSTIEQRTGRIDRIGCKAEGKHSIHIYLPFIAGMTDERQYKVMTDREQWFRVVMGQEEVAKLVAQDGPTMIPLPDAVVSALSFRLAVDG